MAQLLFDGQPGPVYVMSESKLLFKSEYLNKFPSILVADGFSHRARETELARQYCCSDAHYNQPYSSN